MDSNRVLEKEVAGQYTTLKVYLYMLKVKKCSARQAQKALLFSSPTQAAHHLEKLQSYNLAKKDNYGVYHVIPKSFGILKLFFFSGRWIIPHTFFIAVIFAVMTAGFLLNITQHGFFKVALAMSVLGLMVSVYETIRFYCALPRV